MPKQYSIAEAKNRLPSIVHDVEAGPMVELTRRGKAVAVLMSLREYEKITRKKTGFWDAMVKFRKEMAMDIADVSDADFASLRDIGPGRDAEIFE